MRDGACNDQPLMNLRKYASKAKKKYLSFRRRAAQKPYEPRLLAQLLEDTGADGRDPKELTFTAIHSQDEYRAYLERMQPAYEKRRLVEQLLCGRQDEFRIYGYNALIREMVDYWVSYAYGKVADGRRFPNYREMMICPITGLSCRIRATLLSVEHFLGRNALKGKDVYLTEQVTRVYKYFKSVHPRTVGSEYLGAGTRSGTLVNGVRHEDITALSFPDASFDLIATFEVLEHVPDYRQAYHELYRCTRPGGTVLITAPFDPGRYEHDIRARLNVRGEVEHLQEPEYHGDPMNMKGGILCFQYFGWRMLAELKEAGFREAKAVFTWSLYHGILGGDIVIIYATK